MLTVSQLRDVEIVDNDGFIQDYPELSCRQRTIVIKEILAIFNGQKYGIGTSDSATNLKANMDRYLSDTSYAGRSLYQSFPDFIIRDIIQKYGPKMIDHLLLQDD